MSSYHSEQGKVRDSPSPILVNTDYESGRQSPLSQGRITPPRRQSSPDITVGLGLPQHLSKRTTEPPLASESFEHDRRSPSPPCTRDFLIMQGTEPDPSIEMEAFKWTTGRQITLHRLMIETDFIPAGYQKHIQMIELHQRFCSEISMDLEVDVLWDYLKRLYDLKALEGVLREGDGSWEETSAGENENEMKIIDFELPLEYLMDEELEVESFQ